MANTNRIDRNLFDEAHYLGKPAADDDRIISRRIEVLNEYPLFFGKTLSCIEVGCGTGATLTRVAERFGKAVGVDIYDYAETFAQQKERQQAPHAEFRQMDLEQELPEDRPFDRLISFEVIEHLKNENSIAAYNQVLQPGGLAAITVPNKWWIFETHGAKLPLLPWNRVPFFSWLPRPIHERYANARIYTQRRIIRLLEKHGFEIVAHRYITAPMDVLKEGRLKRFLTRYIFRGNTTSVPFFSTAIFVIAKKIKEHG